MREEMTNMSAAAGRREGAELSRDMYLVMGGTPGP
jgi:hypothetical protein